MNRLTIAGTVEKTVSPVGNSDKLGEILIRVPERKKDASGKYEQGHSFLPVKLFGKALESAKKHLTRGSKCFVVGKVEGREYNGKYYTSVVAEEVFPLAQNEDRGDLRPPDTAPAGAYQHEIDDIPF